MSAWIALVQVFCTVVLTPVQLFGYSPTLMSIWHTNCMSNALIHCTYFAERQEDDMYPPDYSIWSRIVNMQCKRSDARGISPERWCSRDWIIHIYWEVLSQPVIGKFRCLFKPEHPLVHVYIYTQPLCDISCMLYWSIILSEICESYTLRYFQRSSSVL